MFFYGWALLNTVFFAPRSLPFLGAAFVIAGMFFFFCNAPIRDALVRRLYLFENIANVELLITFGGFHIFYATSTKWTRPWRV